MRFERIVGTCKCTADPKDGVNHARAGGAGNTRHERYTVWRRKNNLTLKRIWLAALATVFAPAFGLSAALGAPTAATGSDVVEGSSLAAVAEALRSVDMIQQKIAVVWPNFLGNEITPQRRSP